MDIVLLAQSDVWDKMSGHQGYQLHLQHYINYNGMLKCQLCVYNRISQVGTFHLLFYNYYEFGSTFLQPM